MGATRLTQFVVVQYSHCRDFNSPLWKRVMAWVESN